MRHKVYGYKLSRDKDERGRLFKSLVSSLITYGYLETSQAKAKAVKGLVDKIINLAKDKNRQRLIPSFITDKNLQDRLVKEIVPKLGSRTSGYTSMVKLGTRYGDQTMMVRMGLIGIGEMKPMEKVQSSKLKVKSEEKEKIQLKSERKITRTRPIKKIIKTVAKRGGKKP